MLSFSSHQQININMDDIPIERNDNEILVRTGVDPDGNCFFHAYLYSVEAPTYRELNYDQRLQRAMELKHFFSDLVNVDDILDIIDVVTFETILGLVEKHLKGYKLPDLSKQPLLSLRNYLLLIYESHPELNQDESFQYMIHLLQNDYLQNVREYICRDGSWMMDCYITLFMQKFKINIIMISHDTKKRITHYPSYNGSSIIIYHISNHFESVGCYDKVTQHMKRLFTN